MLFKIIRNVFLRKKIIYFILSYIFHAKLQPFLLKMKKKTFDLVSTFHSYTTRTYFKATCFITVNFLPFP